MQVSRAFPWLSSVLRTVQQDHKQASLDAQSAVAADSIIDALRANRTGWMHIHRETTQRAQWRALFNAAVALPDTLVAVTYLKAAGDEPRTMLCQAYEVDADATKRYATVWDVESGDYRRVNLDTIVKLTLETHALPSQCPRCGN